MKTLCVRLSSAIAEAMSSERGKRIRKYDAFKMRTSAEGVSVDSSNAVGDENPLDRGIRKCHRTDRSYAARDYDSLDARAFRKSISVDLTDGKPLTLGWDDDNAVLAVADPDNAVIAAVIAELVAQTDRVFGVNILCGVDLAADGAGLDKLALAVIRPIREDMGHPSRIARFNLSAKSADALELAGGGAGRLGQR